MLNKNQNSRKNKLKFIKGTVLGMMLFLSTVVVLSFVKKMDVEGEDYIETVETALTSLKNSGYSANTESILYQYLNNKSASTEEVAVSLSNDYQIYNEYDWLALTAFSYYDSLDDCSFVIQNGSYDLRNIVINEEVVEFRGLSGNAGCPFKGDLVSSLGEKSIGITVSSPLFNYLDASANINPGTDNIDFVLTVNGATSGLAQVLVGSGEVSDSTIRNVYIEGSNEVICSVSNMQGYAGGIFGEIKGTDSNDPLFISSLGVMQSVSSVEGRCAGGFAGRISGNVQLILNTGMWNTDTDVFYGSDGTTLTEFNECVGSVIGEICGDANGNPDVSVPADITLHNVTKGAAYTGGFVGKAADCSIFLLGNVTIQKEDGTAIDLSCTTGSPTHSGGFAGSLVNVSVSSADEAVVSAKIKGNAYYSGGFAGYIRLSDIMLPGFVVSYESTSGSYAGGFVGHSWENDNVTIDNVNVNSVIINGSAACAGGLIGHDESSSYTINAASYDGFSVKINCAGATSLLGGLAGELISTALITPESGIEIQQASIASTTNSLNSEKSVCVGGFIGKYINNKDENVVFHDLEATNLSIHAMTTESNYSYVGGIIGAVDRTEGNGTVTIERCETRKMWTYPGANYWSHTTDNVNNEGKYMMYAGGVLGGNFIPDTILTDVASQVGDQWRNVYCYGGAVSLAAENCTIDSLNAKNRFINTTFIASNANFMKINGGIVGEIKDGIKVDVGNVKFSDSRLSHRWNTYVRAGGIAGKTGVGSVLHLYGTIDLSLLKPASDFDMCDYYGSIVGEQNNSLVFIDPISYEDSKYVYGYSISENGFADEIGNYGSAYRNGNWDGTPNPDMTTDKSSWMIQADANGDIVISADPENSPYTLNSVGDAMRLSIALNSENVFSGFDIETYTCPVLLNGDYSLEADLDLSNTGIQTLNKNEVNVSNGAKAIYPEDVFTGSIIGTNETDVYTIKNSFSAVNQGYLGLFSSIGEDEEGNGPVFKNIGIDSSVEYYYNVNNNPYATGDTEYDTCDSVLLRGTQHFGGIAPYAEGNVTVDNVELDVTLDMYRCLHNWGVAGLYRYYGGAIGHYKASSGKTLSFNDVTVNANLKVSENNHFAGGLVGYIDNTNSDSTGVVNVTDTTVSGVLSSIYRSAAPAQGAENLNDPAKIGGIIASVGSDTQVLESSVDNKLSVNLSGLRINGLQIQDANTERANAYEPGGLIGYKWKNVDVTVSANAENIGITVDNGTDAAGNPVTSGFIIDNHTLGANYGGLWNTVAGHMKISDVTINSMNINVVGSPVYSNGLLVGDGRYLYMELDGASYNIMPNTVIIADSSAEYFDEIIGCTWGNEAATSDTYGGVISISRGTKGEFWLYNNQVVKQENPNTRYYYDLETDMEPVLTDENELLKGNTFTVSSKAKMLQWSLGHHLNKPLRQFFNIYASYSRYNENVTFANADNNIIDLEDSSFYAPSITGGTYQGDGNTKIIFHGESFDNLVTAWRSNAENVAERFAYVCEDTSEHHLLHSGLFYNASITTIDQLVLSGTVTSVYMYGHMYSGALICGSLYGQQAANQPEDSEYIVYDKTPTTITNIVFDGLSVSHILDGTSGNKNDTWNDFYGLMISSVGSGAVVQIGLDETSAEATTSDGTAGVSMINYNTSDFATNKVAAALIGQVGYEESQGMNISFYNMKIADIADEVANAADVGREDISDSDSAMSLTGGKVLAHASFIYSYNYDLDNTTGIYIFYEKEYTSADKNVTLGNEIKDVVQFYDPDCDESIYDQTHADDALLDFDWNNYKPYVYSIEKDIDVNPKNGNIIEGCGTYDDPYIINKAAQLMSLYYYLKDYNTYESVLNDWEINAYGTDTVTDNSAVPNDCNHVTKYYNIGDYKDADDAACDNASTYESLTNAGFPTVEQLSNAYYMITADIDLSLEDDFTGFGTEELPFTGVFVGAVDADNNESTLPVQAKITMAMTNEQGAALYGFVKYAKGAVVRNMHIDLSFGLVRVTDRGTGGGVFGVVLGGDNIIDNVKVSGAIEALSYEMNKDSGSFSEVGGYAGFLQNGSLILRGYESDALSDFVIVQGGDANVSTSGRYQRGMVGKIGNGYIVDDDATPESATNISTMYQANPAKKNSSLGTGIVMNATDTQNYADSNGSSVGTDAVKDTIAVLNKSDKISASQDNTAGYQYSLNSAQDILVVAFAINSGSMNYCGDYHLDNRYTGKSANEQSLSLNKTTDIYGYDIYSRCRIEDYSYVGAVDTSDGASMAAYLNVIKYDNRTPYTNDEEENYVLNGVSYGDTFYRPYIFNYFDFSDEVEIFRSSEATLDYKTMSFMNACSITSSKEKYQSTYTLAAGNYDMTQLAFKKCFRGIGAPNNYKNGNNTIYCSFQGNFVGVGSSATKTSYNEMTQIKIDLDIEEHPNAGFFTMLAKQTNDGAYPYTIKGFNLSGSVDNRCKEGYVIAGGISSIVQGSYLFEDVAVGSYWSGENAETGKMSCTSTYVKGDGVTNFNSAAAFIVRCENNVPNSGNTTTHNNPINFTDCKIINTTVDSWDESGGFYAMNEYNTAGNSFVDCVVTDSVVKTMRGGVGGYVGVTNADVSFDGCILNSTTVKRHNEDSKETADNKHEGIGGYVGTLALSCENAVFNNCQVTNTTADGKMEVSATPYNARHRNNHVGGYIGYAADYGNESTEKDANGNTVKIENETGIVKIDNCTANGLTLLQSTVSHMGGFIGYTEKLLSVGTEENSEIEITDLTLNRSFFNSTGGFIGQFSVLDSANKSYINNVTLTGLQIEQGWEGNCDTGGIVGHHSMGMLEINDTKVCGTAQFPVKIKFNIGAMEYTTVTEKDASGNAISVSETSRNLNVGGIVGHSTNGYARLYCKLTLNNCSLEGESGTDDVKLLNGRYVGGMIGSYESRNGIAINNCSVKNATIQAIYTNDAEDSSKPVYYSSAGGFYGQIKLGGLSATAGYGERTINNPVISNVKMTNYNPGLSELNQNDATAVTRYNKTKDARNLTFGGLIGITEAPVTITDINIDKLQIGVDGYVGEAGGVVGMAIATQYNNAQITIKASDPTVSKNVITNSQIIAGVAGGVIGNTQKGSSAKFAPNVNISDVSLDNMTVFAKFIPGSSWRLYAGGIVGRHQPYENSFKLPSLVDKHIYENISINNSVISSFRTSNDSYRYNRTSLGGFIGGHIGSSSQSNNVALKNVLIGSLKIPNSIESEEMLIIPTYDNVLNGNVQLYRTLTTHGGTYLSFKQEAITAGKCTVSPNYVMNAGTFVGDWTANKNSYILNASVEYDSDVTDKSVFRPAIDVGADFDEMMQLLTDAAVTMDDAYKTYMDSMHIVYKEDFTSKESPSSDNHYLISDELGLSDDYRFAQLDAIMENKFVPLDTLVSEASVDNNCDYRLDYNHNQNSLEDNVTGKVTNYEILDVLDVSYHSDGKYLSPYEYNGKKIPMLVSAGKYDINTVINTAINVLTNNGGATDSIYNVESAAKSGLLLSVDIERVKYQPDYETDGDDTTTSLFVRVNDNKTVLHFDSETGVFSIDDEDFDSIDEQTFNLVTVKYQHTDSKVYTIHIPVFVRETLKIATHMKGVTGSNYQISNIPMTETEQPYTEINVELNNSFTLYSEFIYSSAREEYQDVMVDKKLYHTNQKGEVVPFADGTQITLLDITGNNMVYFYQVSGNVMEIPFTEFVSMDGKKYVTGDLADLTAYKPLDSYNDRCNIAGTAHEDVGLEQFLIIIDETNVVSPTRAIYNYYVRADEVANKELFKNATITDPCYVVVNEIPGLVKFLSGSTKFISYEADLDQYEAELNAATGSDTGFVREPRTVSIDTYPEPQISRDGTLGLSGTAYIMSPTFSNPLLPDYWSFFDGEDVGTKHGQYIEFAISLESISTGKRVEIPDETTVSINIGGIEYGATLVNNAEYVYCYFDTQNLKTNPLYQDINKYGKNTAVDFDVNFNFTTATNFSGISDDTYKVKVELLDTTDPSYPRNGSQCDVISIGSIVGINKRNLGFTLETNEILTLGMNAYNSEFSDKGRIEFKSRLDFSDYFDEQGEGQEQLVKHYSDKYFTYTFVIERKEKISTGEAVSFDYDTFTYNLNGMELALKEANKYAYPIKVLDGQDIKELEDIPASSVEDVNKKVILQKTKKYEIDISDSLDVIEDTISLNHQIMEEEFTLFADVEELIKTPENITNYKVTCYVTISDTEPTELIDISSLSDTDKKAEDFFIFTVAKLKTDMD